MITEERTVHLSQGQLSPYLELIRNTISPSIRASGGRILCLLQGLIGSPSTKLLQMTQYENIEAWQLAQGAWTTNREEYIIQESTRILKPISSRPKEITPPEDRRAIYGYRKFTVSSSSIAEFTVCSEEGIWPRLEKDGACILGMWSNAESVSPSEVILLTGYNSLAHWESTRFPSESPTEDNDLWNRESALRSRREQLTQQTFVEIMMSADL